MLIVSSPQSEVGENSLVQREAWGDGVGALGMPDSELSRGEPEGVARELTLPACLAALGFNMLCWIPAAFKSKRRDAADLVFRRSSRRNYACTTPFDLEPLLDP